MNIMSTELKPYFIEPKKSGRLEVRDKYNDLILQAGSEWARDKLFDMIIESEQLRKERDEALELAKKANGGYLHMINLHNNYLSEQITSTDLDEPDYIDHQDVAEIGQAIEQLNQD